MVSFNSLAQNLDSLAKEQSDSLGLAIQNKTEPRIDTVAPKVTYPFFSDVSVVLDYGKILSIASDFESKGEIGLELGIKNRFFLSTEYGMSKLTPRKAYANANYESKGNYLRVGLGYRRMVSAKINMGFSFRYASAKFTDGGNIMIQSSSGLFDSVSEIFERKDVSANWYELVFNSESQLKKNLYAGLYFRIRFMDSYDKQTPLDIYTIPGYGRTFDKSVPVINLYLKYRLKLR